MTETTTLTKCPFLLFISLSAALRPSPLSWADDPDMNARTTGQLRRVMAERPDVRFVLIDERNGTLEETRALLLSDGYAPDVVARISDMTPEAKVTVKGEPVPHLVAPGVEIELYLERTCNRFLTGIPFGYAILINHKYIMLYMGKVSIQTDNDGLTQEAADRLLALIPVTSTTAPQ